LENLSPNFVLLGIVWYIAFLFSTTCHEASHALAAKHGGDLTAARGGQITLDPRPHIKREVMGMVFIPLIFYFSQGWMMGWASAPYDPVWARKYPRRAAWMSLAGPAANLLIALVAIILLRLGLETGLFVPIANQSFMQVVRAPGDGLLFGVSIVLSILFNLNFLLGLFNLLPVPPLDGSSGITLLMPERLLRRWNRLVSQPWFSLLGILLAWQLIGEFFWPLRDATLAILLPA